jgi:hypothetical protein
MIYDHGGVDCPGLAGGLAPDGPDSCKDITRSEPTLGELAQRRPSR